MRLADYFDAIRVAAREVGFFRSILSVISARLYYGIGPRYYSVFRLFGVAKSEWPSYIDSNESNKVTGAVNGKQNYYLARDKLLFYQHCINNGIATVPILGVIGTQDYYGFPRVGSLAEFKAFLSSSPPRIFFKIADGAHGDGAFSAIRSENEWVVGKEHHSPDSLYKRLLTNLPGDSAYLIQPAVKPNKLLRPLMPQDSLGTVRIITYLQAGKATPILPLLRIPANQNVTDNFSLGLSGNLIVPVDIESGVLGIAKRSQNLVWPSMVDLFEHPDTQHRITGNILPFWNEALDLVIKAQEATPQLPTLGWDVAITDDGPLIVEANTLYATEIHQVAYGRGIRSDLMPIVSLLDHSKNVNSLQSDIESV